MAGAFPYPFWILAALGLPSRPAVARSWALAVLVAVLPAIAFSTRFHLPRLAYFAYPAVYLLGRSRNRRPGGLARRAADPAGCWRSLRIVVLLLAALATLDLGGWQGLNVGFHYGKGSAW